MARRFLTIFILLLFGLSAATVFGQNVPKTPVVPVDDLDSLRSNLTVSPQEIDLGVLGPGEEAKGTFYLKNAGPGSLEWFAEGPEGWKLSESQGLSGLVGQTPEPLRIRLVYVKEIGQSKNRSCSLILRMETEGQAAALRREVPVGDLREEIRFDYDGGMISILFHVRLVELASVPLLEVEPLRMDFGTIRPGEQITKRILLKNRGRESLKWKAGVAGGRGMPTVLPPVGRYISLRNEAAGAGVHSFSGPLPEGFELSGNWAEEGGYPSGQGEQSVLRYRFTGTGISLYFRKSPDSGPFSVFLDGQFVSLVDGYSERRERGEAPLIVEGQLEGPHLLTIVNGAEKVTLEGVRVFGIPIQKGPRGWISVFPDSGFTTRETDYINVALNTRQMTPGLYGDHVHFVTNGGEADVEVILRVAAETTSRFMDVHRYLAGSDYLYTTNPQAEASSLQLKGYRQAGIAFRLFAPGTPGTTDFFRWFNPSTKDHYYSYDPKGGKPLPGYLLEGAIGNIATSRLSGTRELYRWFNPTKGSHFFTTDQSGEGITKKGYRFDGIAGFVR